MYTVQRYGSETIFFIFANFHEISFRENFRFDFRQNLTKTFAKTKNIAKLKISRKLTVDTKCAQKTKIHMR
jgi:hypothetical protein